MGLCEGRVVVVTGAGGGIGREHALLFAKEGARVVVNDVSPDAAQHVVDTIVGSGGEAVANTDDISDFAGAARLVHQAVDVFGDLHVLVNNAGILRDRMLANMAEAEWDAVIKVHLKGTFAPTHHAAAYWREQSKQGVNVQARVINTTSSSGVFGNPGQSNYGAAKAGIAAFTIIASQELARYGVTVNAISPTALTSMTENLTSVLELQKQRGDLAPENISPAVVWLGSLESSAVTGRVFGLKGNRITVLEGWVNGPAVDNPSGWSPGELGEVMHGLLQEAAPNAASNGSREVHA